MIKISTVLFNNAATLSAIFGEAFWLHLFLEKGGTRVPRIPDKLQFIESDIRLCSFEVVLFKLNNLTDKLERGLGDTGVFVVTKKLDAVGNAHI